MLDDKELKKIELRVVELVNEERAKNGLNKLSVDDKLMDLAREKSRDMKDNEYFSHTSPTYGSAFDMINQKGITYTIAGENIAKGQKTAEEVVLDWLNSKGHRENILNPSFTKIGVGLSGNLWTQMFIG
ncbi:CAP domain-containing protein [uncultured Tyzzerella sp.]|uniref:CAP domain-containing protein n=1 Tax=uncultured Tyzzerella sp. TaxID=2321398 RepID=UPI002943432E|nr:CAP domain-containing protein [uncultured Tyzzerella sp.]